jgi:pimeloyl-ACP methyl ester carboxylesterase
MSSDRLPRQFCTFAGHRIAYVQLGAGPVVLLLHGLGGTADFWQPLIAALAPTHTVICPDLLGFGFSDKPAIAYTPARHAGAVASVLRASGAKSLLGIVGHSCGGVVAIALLADAQVRTERLALAATPYPSPQFPVRQELLRSPFDRLMLAWTPLAHALHLSIAMIWPIVRHIAVRPELRGAWAGYMDHTVGSYVSTAEECLFRADIDPFLPNVRDCPTLLLYGREDHTVPLMHGERLRAALPRSQLTLLSDGHYAVLQEGQAALISWLGYTNLPAGTG